MWVSCCGCGGRNNCNSMKSGNMPAAAQTTTGNPLIAKETLVNGDYVRNERRSLPDVVLPSTGFSVQRSVADQRPSLQIDAETGRRPTMLVETTARLAESESTVLEENPSSIRRLEPQSDRLTNGRQARSYSLDYAVPLRVGTDQSSAAHSEKIRILHKSNPRKPQNRGVFYRLVSLRTIKNPFRRKFGSFPKACLNVQEERNDINKVKSELLKEEDEEVDIMMSAPVGKSLRDGLVSVIKTSSNDMTTTTQNSSPFPSVVRLPVVQHNSTTTVRRGSLCIFSHADEPIVTPFAQILASLRRVRYNFIQLTNISSSRDSRFGTSHTNLEDSQTLSCVSGHEQTKTSASETLEELEWCLDRLESIQTHRSVSDMATSKFRKMLSKELNQIADGSRNSKQISEYICSTFLDTNEVDAALPSVADSTTADADSATNEQDNRRTTNFPDEHGALPTAGLQVNSRNSTQSASTTALNPLGSKELISPELLPFGVTSEQPENLNRLLTRDLDLWGLDVFELARLTPNPLTCLFYRIIQKRGLIKRFNIPEMNLIRYMNVVEEHYRNVPYHNRIHAADVLQSTHVLLNAQALSTVFTDLEILAILFASAIHDVDHPGVTNQFLVNTNDQLAILYNDTSVLENHHLAVAFQILIRPGCDIFENVSKKQRLSLRRMAIDMVLATDMSKHMGLLADLKTMVETEKVAGSGVLTLDNYSDRMQILQSMIHCADLSNPTKPLEIYRSWNERVMEEHFRQGDQERVRGLELSPMCDRTTASIEKTQVSFIDYIVHPLWETWSELVHPDAQNILDTLDDNREWYLSQIKEEPELDSKDAAKPIR